MEGATVKYGPSSVRRAYRNFPRKCKEGVKRCTMCSKPRPKGRLQYCSNECSDRYLALWSPRRYVLQRDGGICDICEAQVGRDRERRASKTALEDFEVDHRVPLCLGGLHELANMRLLCLECHKLQTKKLAAEMAKVRAFKNRGRVGT